MRVITGYDIVLTVMPRTTVPLEQRTRDRLKRYGSKGESYDQVLNRLMDFLEELDLEAYIEERHRRLQREKNRYVSLEELDP